MGIYIKKQELFYIESVENICELKKTSDKLPDWLYDAIKESEEEIEVRDNGFYISGSAVYQSGFIVGSNLHKDLMFVRSKEDLEKSFLRLG